MKTPQQIRNEVEKGCGKYIGTWKTSQKIICGCYTNMLELCPKCQAKLSILTEYDKAIKEMIEDLLKGFRTQIGYRIIHENNEDRELFSFKQIKLFIEQELLSKINSVSTQELKQTRGRELKSDEGLHSTEYGFPADTSFLGGYAEFWDNKEDDRWDKEEITGGDGE